MMLQQIAENRIVLPPDLEQAQEVNHFLDLINRTVMDEFQVQQHRETDLTLQEAMVNGHLTSFYTPDRIVTPARVLRNGHMKSAWFRHAEHLGLENPSVFNYSFGRPPDEDASSTMEEHEEEVRKLLERVGQKPYLWSTSEKLTIFAASPSELRFLPQDHTSDQQESASGLAFLPGADPGKTGKRLRAYAGAPGTFFDPRPSAFPQLNLGGEIPLRVKARDSGTVGDGGGSCPQSIAREILELSRAPLWGDIIAFQMVILGADYSFKALVNVVPDELWTDPGCDLLVDAKSINHQVHSTRVTVGKLIPTRHHTNKRHFYVEPMNLGEVVNRFIDAGQLTQQAMVIAENLDRETWDQALGKSQELLQELVNNTEIEGEWDSTQIRMSARKQPEERNGLLLAYEECLRSPFGLPSIISFVAEGPAKTWRGQLNKSRKRPKEEERDEKPTLSGITVSGEKLLLMDPGYAGVPYPRKGYIGLVWHPRRKSELIGLVLSKADMLKFGPALDGVDVDGDKGQMIPMQDDRGKPLVLLMRSPMSIDGGVCLRLRLKDAALLREVGYHFYRQTGGHKYPGLYEAENGKALYQDVLHAKPHEDPPQWTTDPDMMVRRTLEMNQYRGIMGKVCLAAANLDFAGLYNPAKHKFNMSEEVIDPSLNASADPTPVLMPLQMTIVDAVRKGIPLDQCLFHRIKSGIRQILQEQHPGEEFDPILHCQDHHHEWREGQENAIRFLEQRVKERALMAHGPSEWLTEARRPKLCNLVVRALEERMTIWADKASEEKLLRDDPEVSGQHRESMIAILIQDAKDAEAALLRDAYQKAVGTIDDLEPGQFMAAWVQATISRAKRSRRFEPIRVGALLKLPPEEIQGFFRRGESVATAIIRSMETVELEEGRDCHVIRTKRNGRDAFQLVDSEDGEVITDLCREANNYEDLDLEFIGYMPKLRVTLRKDNRWKQAESQMVFRVKNPRDA